MGLVALCGEMEICMAFFNYHSSLSIDIQWKFICWHNIQHQLKVKVSYKQGNVVIPKEQFL